ncbi:hypothetical protein Micbo1qcDRAFT_231256 [Microdochium bolleyi]|uniref:Alpha-ketoglutarate-dependent sulfonate dioxygenase n=1 Tax=Microdochium bolleyi TaxID=196109 RepID=A0A136JG84_9PEZI|nr:hypothetical protein Micbo1qcDRAFT_231256 [Microdochium bolleyi]
MAATAIPDLRPRLSHDSVLPPYRVVDTNPPTYHAPPELSPESLAELNSALTSINLNSKQCLSEDRCLAHLKLLSAFQQLKDDVGYNDGLWELFDSRALASAAEDPQPRAKKGEGAALPVPNESDPVARNLARLREKRWALFVARAVDRYAAWWHTFTGTMLTEDMLEGGGPEYVKFPAKAMPAVWTMTKLPPLDVILVWHAHMLNPRNFLEDCIRSGLGGLWAAGLPWEVLNPCIDDTTFKYTTTSEGEARWATSTGRAWDSTEDHIEKTIKCPKCSASNSIPWTTCGRPESEKRESFMDLQGRGFGDGDLCWPCEGCSTPITSDLLEVESFVDDFRQLLLKGQPMPGTILNFRTGLPNDYLLGSKHTAWGQTFPNRLLKHALRSDILALLDVTEPTAAQPSIETVRMLVQGALQSGDSLKAAGVTSRAKLTREGRVHTRQMMSRYWNNKYPFALDLAGAVHRQGIFVEKMYKIDWLHSPSARKTMTRLIKKYQRFMKLISDNPLRVVVPTLDVDLAWHTHQLSPREYHSYTTKTTKKLIDHDDKIEDLKLHDAFTWTTQEYQRLYDEVYSECTCWYCETIRTSQVSSVGRLFGASRAEKISDAFHDSGRAKLCPADNSAHISTHNSVSLNNVDGVQNLISTRRREALMLRMLSDHKKAQARAAKKGRKVDNHNNDKGHHWGYPYAMAVPFAVPVVYGGYMYAGGDPTTAASGTGAAGGCAAGSCAGGAAAGACAPSAGGCGGAGGCGTTGGCGAGGAACGGSGGSCGGGGGGCGGGGGGGGCGGGGS